MSDTPLDRAFDALFARWSATLAGGLPREEHDPEWASPCEIGNLDEEGRIAWRPVARPELADVVPLAGISVPESLRRYLGARYFGSIRTRHRIEGERLSISLRSVWNDADLSRTLAGAQQEIERSLDETGRPLFCIANTDDDRFFAVSLATGEVTLEDFGRPPTLVAASLEAFLDLLASA